MKEFCFRSCSLVKTKCLERFLSTQTPLGCLLYEIVSLSWQIFIVTRQPLYSLDSSKQTRHSNKLQACITHTREMLILMASSPLHGPIIQIEIRTFWKKTFLWLPLTASNAASLMTSWMCGVTLKLKYEISSFPSSYWKL